MYVKAYVNLKSYVEGAIYPSMHAPKIRTDGQQTASDVQPAFFQQPPGETGAAARTICGTGTGEHDSRYHGSGCTDRAGGGSMVEQPLPLGMAALEPSGLALIRRILH